MTLTEAQMPSHGHKPHYWGVVLSAGGNTGQWSGGGGGALLDTFGQDNDQTRRTENAGGGGSHPNLQPYITCYMFKRTVYGNIFGVGGVLFEDKKEHDGQKPSGDIISTSQYHDWLRYI